MSGSMGPRFLSAGLRVLDAGFLVISDSSCFESGPGNKHSASVILQTRTKPGLAIFFFSVFGNSWDLRQGYSLQGMFKN